MRWLVTKQMVALAVVAMIVALCTSSAQAQDANDPNNDSLFDPNRIHSYYFTMDGDDWNDLVESCAGTDPPGQCPPDANCDHYYWQATLTCGDLGPMLVGIRRKNGLGEPDDANDPQKVSLKIEINLFAPGQLFAGKKKLSLENGGEGALITEGLSWLIYEQAGIISGRASWCKVYVNGVYKGLYINVEQVDKRYLDDNGLDGNDNTGFLYKHSEYCGEEQRTREGETSPFAFNWYPFDHPGYMTETIPPPNDWLEQTQWRVDIPQLLALAAVENFTSNTDALVMKATNFWYYDWSTDPNDDPNFQQPRLYLPWDLDTTLKTTDLPIMNNVWTSHIQEGLIDEVDESGTPFGYPTHQADYLDTYAALLNGPLGLSSMLDLVDNIEAAIATEVDADPYQQTGSASAEFDRIRDFLADRTDYVTMQLEMLVPPPGTVLLDDDFGGSVWDANWTNSGTWVTDSGIYGQQLPSAKAPQKATGTLACIDLDTSDANAVYVKFSVQKDDTEVTEDIILSYYNGTSFVDVCDLHLHGDDDMWLLYNDKITDSNFFVSDFKIRFAAALENGENVWVDDVMITKTVPEAVLPLIYGHTDRSYSNVTADQIDQDYTATLLTYTISGAIVDANTDPVVGVSVDADNGGGSDTTDPNGEYSLTVNYDWSGTVTPTKTGYTFAPTDRPYSNVTSDQIDQDYTATLLTYTISGTVTSGGPGLDGVTMDGLPGNPVTAGGGLYNATVPYNWGGTVTPTKAGYTFVPASRLYSNVTSNQTNQDYDGTLLTYSISGTILGPGSAPVPGVSVDADNGGGSDVTDPNGEYSLTVNYDWSGTVTPTKANYTFAPTDRSYSNVTSNQSAQDYTGTHICDIYPDGIIDLKDVDVVCENWLTVGPAGDIDNSAFVDLGDFTLVADAYKSQ